MQKLAIMVALIPWVAFGDGVTGKITQASCKFSGSNISVVVTYNLALKVKKATPPTVRLYTLYDKTDSSRLSLKESWSPGFSDEQYDVAKIKSGTWRANLPVRESKMKGLLAWRVELWFQGNPIDIKMSMPIADMENHGLGTNWWTTATL